MKTFLGFVLCGALAASGCGEPAVSDACTLDFAHPIVANFGNDDLDALLEASARFSVTANVIDTEVRAACNRIATELGAASSTDTEIACNRAIDEVERIKARNDSASLVVEYTPGACRASPTALVDCVAACDADFDATVTSARCVGGLLSGYCGGVECCGSCTVEGTVACTGWCDGSCEGSCAGQASGACTGQCTGQCEGHCTVLAEDGSCAGACDGTCRGSCLGTLDGECAGNCNGTCTGSCRYNSMTHCAGVCSGSCDLDYVAPRCEGGRLEIAASAECKTACEVESASDFECTEPVLLATFSGSATAPADLEALLATLHANLPTLIAAGGRAGDILAATSDFATHLGAATSAAAASGLQAGRCLVLATDAQRRAMSTLNVTLTATVSISGSANATSL